MPHAIPGTQRTRRAAALVFAALLGSYVWFFQGGGWNPNSRLDLTRALAEQATIRIDAYYQNTGDWARREGHFYTNKAPGLSFASVPVFRVAAPLARALLPDDPARRLGLAAYLTNAVVNALPSAWLGVLLFRVLGRLGIGGARRRAWLCLAFGLGTLAFPYATAYYGHQPAAVLGFAAFAALLDAWERPDARGRALWAGAAAGAAVAVESSALLTAVVLGAITLAHPRRRELLPRYLLGALPPAALLAAYHAAAFGHPLENGFAYANPGSLVMRDGRLFGAPTPARLYGLLFSPHRGLFFTSPLLLLAPFGWPGLRRANPRAAAACAAIPVAFLILFASFYAWDGGWAAGPRYLVPCLPFAFVPVAFAATRVPALACALAGISAAVMLAITAVAVEVPRRAHVPLLDFTLPHLARGHVSVNPQGFDEARPAAGYRNLRGPQNASSFNLGELLWPRRLLSLAPLLGLQAALALAIARLGRSAEP